LRNAVVWSGHLAIWDHRGGLPQCRTARRDGSCRPPRTSSAAADQGWRSTAISLRRKTECPTNSRIAPHAKLTDASLPSYKVVTVARDSLIRRKNSLMARINSLQGRIKFPVPMRRKLGRKPLNSAIDFEPIVALGGLDEQNSRNYVADAPKTAFADSHPREC
jgi:hypothetical protein